MERACILDEYMLFSFGFNEQAQPDGLLFYEQPAMPRRSAASYYSASSIRP
jgi:hypothetical protein